MGNKIYLKEIIDKLQKDERIKNYNGNIIPYNRYEYKKILNNINYTEISQYGYKISILINKNNFIPNNVTIYVWGEENNNNIYIKNSIKNEIFIINRKEEHKIIHKIITLLLEKEICKKDFMLTCNF